VKWISWVELGVFSLLILFWLLPGFDGATMVFGWAHGLGFIALCMVIWVACGKRQAPYTLLAATLTPVSDSALTEKLLHGIDAACDRWP